MTQAVLIEKPPVASRYYDKKDEVRNRYMSFVKGQIQKSEGTLLNKMSQVVERKLHSYHGDFYVIDVGMMKEQLKLYGHFNFIWLVRGKGTHIIDLNVTAKDKEANETYFEHLKRSFEKTLEAYLIVGDTFEEGKFIFKKITLQYAETLILNNSGLGVSTIKTLSETDKETVKMALSKAYLSQEQEWYAYDKTIWEKYFKGFKDDGLLHKEGDVVLTATFMYKQPMLSSFISKNL